MDITNMNIGAFVSALGIIISFGVIIDYMRTEKTNILEKLFFLFMGIFAVFIYYINYIAK